MHKHILHFIFLTDILEFLELQLTRIFSLFLVGRKAGRQFADQELYAECMGQLQDYKVWVIRRATLGFWTNLPPLAYRVNETPKFGHGGVHYKFFPAFPPAFPNRLTGFTLLLDDTFCSCLPVELLVRL